MHLGSREGQDSTDAHRVGRGASQGAAGPGDQGRRDTSAGGAEAAAPACLGVTGRRDESSCSRIVEQQGSGPCCWGPLGLSAQASHPHMTEFKGRKMGAACGRLSPHKSPSY